MLMEMDQQQDVSFHSIKTMVTQDLVLAFYDPKPPVKLSVDASIKGLGGSQIILSTGKSCQIMVTKKHSLGAHLKYMTPLLNF